jgi:hypothetical protein
MASLVDVNLEQGDAKRLIGELQADAQQEAPPAKPAAENSGAKAPAEPKPTHSEDPRFTGKSREDLLEMYRNLESHNGRLANEFGQTKRTLDELLIDKRARDLNANGAPAVDNIDPTDLLVKPKEVLDKFVDAKAQELVRPLTQKIDQLEAQLLTNSFAARHSDANTVAHSPEFKDWVNKTPLRQQLAANAAAGNMQAADALLSEFKASAPAKASGTHLEAALNAANRASLEGSNNAADPAVKPAGKVFKRADVIALRSRDPDAYERLSPQIEAAYREGRVVG